MMASIDFAPSDLLIRHLTMGLNRALEEVAEAHIQAQLARFDEERAKLEQKLRERTGAMLIGLIEQNVSMYQREEKLIIELKQVRQK